jgi:uncharacterized protein (DUF849 family)
LSKLIITCAIKGSEKQKKDTRFIPIMREEIAESSIAAAKTEASVIQCLRGGSGDQQGALDGGLYERASSMFLDPPDFLELLAKNAEESEVNLELECLHAGMLHWGLLWAW